MSEPDDIFDIDVMLRRRARHAARADEVDFLIARAADDISERIGIVNRTFATAACLGALHGVVARRVQRLENVGTVISCERTAALLERCEAPRIQADEEALPFADASLDLAVSALTLHLVNDLPGALIQIRRALKPDGLFVASLLGGETLKELREAWLIAESEIAGGASPRVAPFADVRDLGGLLQRAGFALPIADSERVIVTYGSPLALMAELKAMAASNMLKARRREPVTRDLLMRAAEVYSDRFGQADGRVRATFEIITLTAWAPDESQPKPLRPGSAKTRLATALGVDEHKLPNETDRTK